MECEMCDRQAVYRTRIGSCEPRTLGYCKEHGRMVSVELPNGRKMRVPLPKGARDGKRFRFGKESFSDRKQPYIWLTVKVVPETPQQA